MKKRIVTIGALLLAMTSFSQVDTLEYSISGKCIYNFDYNANLISLVKTKKYKSIKFKLKKDEFLYLDLVDEIKPDTLYSMYRNIAVYWRDGCVETLRFSSKNNTLSINGKFVNKIVVYKPKLK
tara:strand:+ start:751 stop:1122 length:372 start_codon:yes stop_codon:yes gene_type:complete